LEQNGYIQGRIYKKTGNNKLPAIDKRTEPNLNRQKIIRTLINHSQENLSKYELVKLSLEKSKVSKIQNINETQSKFTGEEFLQLTFGDNIVIILPKKGTKRFWDQVQLYMDLYFRNQEEATEKDS